MERLQGVLKLPLGSRPAKKISTFISAALRPEWFANLRQGSVKVFSPLNMERLQGVQKLPPTLGRPIRFLLLMSASISAAVRPEWFADLRWRSGKVFSPLNMERLQGVQMLPCALDKQAYKISTSISAAVRPEWIANLCRGSGKVFSPLNMERMQGVQKLPRALGKPIRCLLLFLLR